MASIARPPSPTPPRMVLERRWGGGAGVRSESGTVSLSHSLSFVGRAVRVWTAEMTGRRRESSVPDVGMLRANEEHVVHQ
jgi:hypothetical protein